MNYSLFLLAIMVGAARAVELDWKVMGVTTIGDPCSAEDDQVLYEECVEDVAVAMGIGDLFRRLELRGNRGLDSCPPECCGPDCPDCACYPKGTYCFTHGCNDNGRRLRVADEQAHTERFLYAKGKIQQAANECLDRKITEGYKCLGNPEDLTVKLFLSEE
jgi:hypothetical protein